MAEETKGIEIVELEPTPPPEGPTLGDALANMDPSLAVEPVPEADEDLSGDEELEVPGDEVDEELEDVAPGPPDDELEKEELEEEEAEDEGEPIEGEVFTLAVGDVELELDVEDEETRAALVEMQNDLARVGDVDTMVTRAQEATQKNQQDALYLQQVEDELRIDPAGYIADKVHPSIQVEVAKALLFNDEVLRAVEDTITEWLDDPAKRRVDQAERKEKRIDLREQFREQRERQVTDQENAKAVFGAIMDMTPDDMDHETAKMFHTDALTDLQNYVRTHKITTLDPEQVPHILASRMQLYGIGTNARVVRAQPAPKGDKDLADKIAEARETGEKIRKRVARRKKVATSPSGAGGAPGRTQIPKGATLDTVLKDLKERVRQ